MLHRQKMLKGIQMLLCLAHATYRTSQVIKQRCCCGSSQVNSPPAQNTAVKLELNKYVKIYSQL